ncbi:MAG: hypothetical protein PF495_15820 [Spirochaetales bacterium]|jgi:cytochrome c peroxidase|nr:hypothetical protein [Spirochaetales bacterium]
MKQVLLCVTGVLVLFHVCTGCLMQPAPEGQSLDGQLAKVITTHSLSGDPRQGRKMARIDSPLAQLGMKLFFSKSLSLGRDTACVSCHHPFLAGGDGLVLPIGVEAVDDEILGQGRTHPGGVFTVPRNSPTIFNSGLWKYTMFVDGRIEVVGEQDEQLLIRTSDSDFGVADPEAGSTLLAAQARFPVTSIEEMRGTTIEVLQDVRKDRREVRRHLVERFANEAGAAEWREEFRVALPEEKDGRDLISFANIAKAIAAYEESQLFIKNPWSAYVQGDRTAINTSEKRGALLFYKGVEQGGAGCVACHSGDFFTDEAYHVLCIPQVGIGKGDGATGTDDFGRFRETGKPEDMYAFRTSSLLNIEVTGPYGHSGFYGSLEEVIRHHFSPAEAIAMCDFAVLDPLIPSKDAEKNTSDVLAHLQKNKRLGMPTIAEVSLGDEQFSDLINFLKALTDPCVKDKAFLQPWVLELGVGDPDGSLLRAVDGAGHPL